MSDTFPEHKGKTGVGRRRAWLTSNVTARELSRQTASLLDEIIEDGRSFTIIRHRRPVAVLGPLAISDEGLNEPAIELEDLQKRLMELLRERSPRGGFSDYLPETPPDIAQALAQLEFAGLVTRTYSGSYALTPRGNQYLRSQPPD